MKKLSTASQINKSDFLDISCSYFSEDYKLFTEIINQGIDSHLEGFTESLFITDDKEQRLYLYFHKSEIHILLRRLEEISRKDENENAEIWLIDIIVCVAEDHSDWTELNNELRRFVLDRY